ncbi:nuclear transport factor 2 family protein [Amycolatopsis anabasis]|uniref:nuclear transport factor 2 family protein n=1 Tax=Amycolatopsis anabasis TaxID=1840409 RepID=UPI001FE4ED34|nr:nuclear transport factor 2 family protein [Amycolatopsis anabasis]
MTLASDAMAVLDRFYAAERDYVAAGGPGRADFGGIAACLDPEVVLYSQPGLPYGGIWRGHAGIERFLGAMSDAWASIDFLDQRQVAEGDRIAVFLRVCFTARATGRAIDTTLLQLNTVRDGLVTEFRPYYWDPAAVAATLAAT